MTFIGLLWASRWTKWRCAKLASLPFLSGSRATLSLWLARLALARSSDVHGPQSLVDLHFCGGAAQEDYGETCRAPYGVVK